MDHDNDNPLLLPWPGPYGGVPPWDAVRPELFPDAFERAIALQRAEVAAISANPEPPTFENTILPLERTGRPLDRVRVLFGVMVENLSTPAYQALDYAWSPRLAAASDDVTFDEGLFSRIEAVYRTDPAPALPATAVEAMRAGALDGVVLMSPRTARVYVDLTKRADLLPAAGKLRYFCLSDAVARELSPLGSVRVKVAQAPHAEEMLALITREAPDSA